jgi:hypothetical protein
MISVQRVFRHSREALDATANQKTRTGGLAPPVPEVDESNIDRNSQTGTPPRLNFAGAGPHGC